MKRLLQVLAAVLGLGTAAATAADLPVKAATPSFLSGYPYAGSGFYFGFNTIGGGGPVSASAVTAPGVNVNGLQQVGGAIGGTLGYVWANQTAFAAVETMFDFQNLNGNSPGLSLSGPAAFEQRFKLGTPLNNVLNFFPNLGLPTIPPFPALPGGQVATNVHPYFMAGIHEDDISANFGLGSNREWEIAPSVGVGAMGQLANGIAVDVWVETVFPERGVCVGPAGSSTIGTGCAALGQQVKAGFAVLY